MKKGSYLILSVAMALLLPGVQSCAHKEVYDEVLAEKVNVIFDWTKSPDAASSQMTLYLYPEGQEVTQYWFSEKTGGHIKAYPGSHTAVCHNNDNAYELFVRNHHSHNEIEIYTPGVSVLGAQGISTRGIPRATGTEEEPLRATPPVCFGARADGISLLPSPEEQTITLYPEQLVTTVTIEFVNVKNLKSADLRIDASISGMAGGFHPGRMTPSAEPVTHTFSLSANSDLTSLSSSFLTFGVPSGAERKHMISVYIMTKNRNGTVYNFDVTDQINNSVDLRNIRIEIPSLVLPEVPDIPDAPGGMEVEISKWNVEYFDIKV